MLACRLDPGIIPEAIKVRAALQAQGLEQVQTNQHVDRAQKDQQIESHLRAILQLLDLDLTDDSLSGTPRRVAKLYLDELFVGLDYVNFPEITLYANKMQVDEMITVRDITLITTCEHHFITIDGTATVAYLPQSYVIGLSKINRVVQFFARRPQIQERLTRQILVALQTLLGTDNVAVMIDAVHYCVKARGICDTNSSTTTTALGGVFKSCSRTRQEFLNSGRLMAK